MHKIHSITWELLHTLRSRWSRFLEWIYCTPCSICLNSCLLTPLSTPDEANTHTHTHTHTNTHATIIHNPCLTATESHISLFFINHLIHSQLPESYFHFQSYFTFSTLLWLSSSDNYACSYIQSWSVTQSSMILHWFSYNHFTSSYLPSRGLLSPSFYAISHYSCNSPHTA